MTSAHLETIFDVVKVVKVLQVSVTSLFQEVLLCLRSGLGMHNFLDVGDNFTMCSNNSDTVISEILKGSISGAWASQNLSIQKLKMGTFFENLQNIILLP